MSWRVSREGKVRGPFTEPEVFELIGRGKVGRGDFVSFSDGQWFPIEEAPAFGPSLPMPAQAMPYVPPPPIYNHYQPSPAFVPIGIPWACPKCGSTAGTMLRSKITTAGWIIFGILVFACFLMCWVGLTQTENVAYCRGCGCRL